MKEPFERSRSSHAQSTDRSRPTGPADLATLCGFALVAVVVLVGWNPASPPIRAIVGLPLLFLAPGYAFVSLCFPAGSSTAGAETARGALGTRTPSDGERLALSFGSSLAILPILGLVIPSVASFEMAPVVGSIAAVTVLTAVGAWLRRLRLAPARRYRPALARRWSTLRSALLPTGSPLLAATNIVLAVSVVVAITTGGYALLSPQDGERYTGMQLLAEDESGELVAAGYPTEIEPGESVPLTVAVDNQEHRDVTYDLVVRQERYVDGDHRDSEVIHESTLSVSDGETVHRDVAVTPTADSGQLRLVYLLYADDVPSDPTPENAYRYTHLWIDVGDTSAGDGSDGTTSPPGAGEPGDGDEDPPDDNESDDDDGDNESDDSDDGLSDDDDESDDGDDDSDDGGNESDDGSPAPPDDGSGDGDGDTGNESGTDDSGLDSGADDEDDEAGFDGDIGLRLLGR
ncbi:putative membrane protein [Halovivax ruber XH-70]|uniref:Putative membrane protein n=1 Tax=Halovivax ruber (strain DSM 18193 / JCM 13892 / XH-70) TaxID=797302 RepID=L0I6V2_HALRX|nr:DUF1616 domain-containing protein [Halovivax ruber]AGB15265.1 putative membrane protein [Halovivax ruber XH-70]